MVVVMDAEGGPCMRVWCLLELWTALRLKGPEALHLVMPKATPKATLSAVFKTVGGGHRGAPYLSS